LNIIELFKAALFGVVEGITEWLPISSTGHMLLLNQFVPLDVSADFWDMFLVVIQLGAIIAVLVLFFHRLNPFSGTKTVSSAPQHLDALGKDHRRLPAAAVIGIPLDNWMEENLGSPYVIAVTLIVYGIAVIVYRGHARER